jgi:hypothetical protein
MLILQSRRDVSCQRGKKYEEKLKSVRHYSFGWNGCQYNFGRVFDLVLL